jgi:peptide deformylase
MAVKRILQEDNKSLRKTSQTVNKANSTEICKIVQDLKDSLEKSKLVGLAAPQIGENYRIFVTNLRQTKLRQDVKQDKVRVFINPKIIEFSKDWLVDYEGCGSVKNGEYYDYVKRAYSIKVEALNEKGNKFQIKAKGLLARAIQHENDHLDGILFIDKIVKKK